ncbi:MAG: DUF1223 domain-containing protein [Kofleriaceae bacterium]
MRAGILVVLAGLALGIGCGPAEGQALQRGPLVVELFTSQGCSSCPPADRLLSKLARNGDLAPLSFHVDYWDDLGWADPFASPAWTARQRAYAQSLGEDRVFTPQLVIGGTQSVVGSNERAVSAALAKAARPARLPITSKWERDALTVTTTAPGDADVFVAVWQATTTTQVARGENAGAQLRSDRVVRRLERVAKAGATATIRIPVAPTWRSVGALAFAQSRDSRIVASAALTP